MIKRKPEDFATPQEYLDWGTKKTQAVNDIAHGLAKSLDADCVVLIVRLEGSEGIFIGTSSTSGEVCDFVMNEAQAAFKAAANTDPGYHESVVVLGKDGKPKVFKNEPNDLADLLRRAAKGG